MTSVLNNASSPQRGNITAIKAFISKDPTPLTLTFTLFTTSTPVTLDIAQRERAPNVQELIEIRDELHPLFANYLDKHCRRARKATSRGKLPHFIEGDFMLVARSEYGAGDKLLLH